MKEVAELLNTMCESGIITNYALFGALAQTRYTEPAMTIDADVLVTVPSTERLDILSSIYKFCAGRGYRAEGEAIQVGAWPVQFVPVFSPLTQEALDHADTADFEGVPLRVVRANYLAVIALSVGRARDLTRILSLLESGSVTREDIAQLAAKHQLSEAWIKFEKRFLND